MSDLTAQKQACIELSNAALALFDLLDEHGEEGPFISQNGLNVIQQVGAAYDAATGPTHDKARRRIAALLSEKV